MSNMNFRIADVFYGFCQTQKIIFSQGVHQKPHLSSFQSLAPRLCSKIVSNVILQSDLPCVLITTMIPDSMRRLGLFGLCACVVYAKLPQSDSSLPDRHQPKLLAQTNRRDTYSMRVG